jgi:hypothetical protein
MDKAKFLEYAALSKNDAIDAAIAYGQLNGFRLSDLNERLSSNASISHLEITDERITYKRDGTEIKSAIKRCSCGELFAFDQDRHGSINPVTHRQPLFKGARQCNVCQLEQARKASRQSSWLHRRKSGQVKAGVAECQHCGKLFDQVRSTAKFCSSRCRVAAHRLTAKA